MVDIQSLSVFSLTCIQPLRGMSKFKERKSAFKNFKHYLLKPKLML